ncbi:MAG: OsmC family peroxiredoxin [Methanobacteriota archaeon]|nr:MAG: OsmC family peroxiredoxin [Euryarchaeota archaeon]
MAENGTFSLELERVNKFEFRTNFDWESVPPLTLDEPEPLGEQKGPNASRLVGAAVGNCLSASLLFCLEKGQAKVRTLKTRVEGFLKRNEKGRLRLGGFDVTIVLDVESEQSGRVSRCLDLFEDYCVVTATIRQAIPVNVRVEDANGNVLLERKESGE